MGKQYELPAVADSSQQSGQMDPQDLVRKLQAGDSVAAGQLHDLYVRRLLSTVRQRMNPALRRRLDPEDIVQSAFRSFFRVVSTNDWHSQGRAGQVWSLLHAITLNKLNAKIRFHAAGKRSVTREVYEVDSICDADAQQAEAIFIDELQRVMCENTPQHRQILELLLSGVSEAEVAISMKCSLRTVYRVLERVTSQLRSQVSV
jgi:DNA-directed RNA polymerase specialized sigma24 family protein